MSEGGKEGVSEGGGVRERGRKEREGRSEGGKE